jgi:glycosyltransferase involved in cell wall biosynthesis
MTFQKSPMKVLVISAAFPPIRGGESDQMLHFSRRLAERGLDVHLLTVKGNGVPAELPFKVHPIMRDWSWSDLPRLMTFLRRCAPQAVFLKYSAWLYNDHPMITFAPTISKFLLPRSPFVTQFGVPDGSRPGRKPRLVRAVRRAVAFAAGNENVDYGLGTLLRDSDRMVVLSEGHAATLSGHLPESKKKMMLIPPPPPMYMVASSNGRNRKRGREMLGLGDQDFVIAYFGVLYRTKGVKTLLRAFQIVSAQRKNLRLVLIGGQANALDGSLYFDGVCELARQLKIEDKITAREYEWDSFDGSLYLHAADACVLPFDQGITLNRSSFGGAIAHGLPIITTRGATLESAFVDGENVLLCQPKDPHGLAAAIESLISGQDLRQHLSEGAAEMAREWFSWDKAIDKITGAFEYESTH